MTLLMDKCAYDAVSAQRFDRSGHSGEAGSRPAFFWH